TALSSGGRVVVFASHNPSLYGTLDQGLQRRERYTRSALERLLTENGFRVEKLFDFNRLSVPGWWLNCRVLKKKKSSRLQLKVADVVMAMLSRFDRVWPWQGLSV